MVRTLFLLGERFDSYSMAAMWDDASWGTRHIKSVERMACITDSKMIQGATRLFAPLLPCDVHVFPVSELAAAKEWIAAE